MTETIPFINPATGEQFGQVAMSGEEDIQQACKELRLNFEVWRRKPVTERVRILRRLQEVIIDSADEITAVINQDTGKSRQDALIEVIMVVDRMHNYYRHAESWLRRRRVPPGLYIFRKYYTEPHPFGVVAVLGPWNYPFDLSMSPVLSALLAGNTVVLKPSEVAAATGVLIQKLFQSVPELAPYVRVFHGDGKVGAAIVNRSPDMVFLTGSVATGKKIAEATAKTLTPFLYELGGKDPMLVLEHADVKAAAKWGVWGAFYNTGQTCMGVERIYAVETVYDAFLTAVLEETQKLKIGYSAEFDNPNHVGPLTFDRQLNIIRDHLGDAIAKGANVLTGGKIEGMFMEPTVVVDVDHSMKLMREETFGPILPIMKVKDETEAIWLANDSHYGLGACVWSSEMQQAKRAARRLQVGSVNINDAISHYPVSLLPFGGVKQSGNARTHGKDEVLQFTQLRSYAIGRPPLPFDLATQMRYPGRYRLGSAIMHFAFGATPRQRVKPAVEAFESLGAVDVKPKMGKAAAVLGGLMGVTAVLFGLFRLRKQDGD
ncbi:MAG: aldehyde dehydrogenase family protein [Chloroflexi bacterium]|nr:aldehyde dehydrogenase family protein [Chloroflexota bacterium]